MPYSLVLQLYRPKWKLILYHNNAFQTQLSKWKLFYSSLCCAVLVQGSFSEANPVIAHVELCVVRSNEDISQNPDGAHGRWNVQPHETWETDCLPELWYFHDVILGLERETDFSMEYRLV